MNKALFWGMALALAAAIGARYGHGGNSGMKFIPVHTPAGPRYVNVSSIVSIGGTLVPQREGMTEVAVGNGETYYTKESVEAVLEKIVEY